MTYAAPMSLLQFPMEAEKMARREFQDPSILTRQSKQGPEYYIRYRVKVRGTKGWERREKWESLGLCAKVSMRQAERQKAKIMQPVNAQVYTAQSQTPWSEFVQAFDTDHVAHLAVPSQDNYRRLLKNHITPAFRDIQVGRIGALEIERLFHHLEATGLSRSTRGAVRGVLAAAFSCARRWKLIEGNPLEGVDVGGGPRAVRECRIPALDEVRRLMALCSGDVPLLIETLCATGMRISEAAGLMVSDLDFAAGLIHVRRRRCRGDVGDTKTFSGKRDLPIGNLAAALAEHVAGKGVDDPVFTYNGEPIVDCALLDNYVTPRMVKLGIKFPGFGWHTFRRLHLSLMSQQGLTLFDLRRQAGHSSIKTTQRYIADDMTRRAEAAGRLFVIGKGA